MEDVGSSQATGHHPPSENLKTRRPAVARGGHGTISGLVDWAAVGQEI
jgi:hypothetical protein